MATLKNIGNYYGATPDRPYHLSVGAVVLDENNNVVCLHYPNIDEITDVYALLNKTVKPGETLEATLNRGAQLELGHEIEIITFLGTQETSDIWWEELGNPTKMEKSVMFFLAKTTNATPETAKEENEEEKREVISKSFDFLIEKMKTQPLKDGMRDFNQSEILRRAKEWINTHKNLVSPTL
jgi:sorbitol-specific phosphotransferase system component IIA